MTELTATIKALSPGNSGRQVSPARLGPHKELKRLTALHHHIIVLHLQGISNVDIATTLDVSPSMVSNTLRSEPAQEIISRHHENTLKELHALLPLSVNAVRHALLDGDPKIQLSAADKHFRAVGLYKEQDAAKETAEDVIARALQVAQTNAETVRALAQRERPRLIDVTPGGETPGETPSETMEVLLPIPAAE
jgi:hypothetical protein